MYRHVVVYSGIIIWSYSFHAGCTAGNIESTKQQFPMEKEVDMTAYIHHSK